METVNPEVAGSNPVGPAIFSIETRGVTAPVFVSSRLRAPLVTHECDDPLTTRHDGNKVHRLRQPPMVNDRGPPHTFRLSGRAVNPCRSAPSARSMTMDMRVRSLLSALVIVCVIIAAALSYAHPPWNPYDNTRFAPITSFGPSIGIEVVARGTGIDPTQPPLTSPLKAVAAPGLPGHVFIVDQVGKLWVVRLSDNTRTLYHDVSARLVPLGVCGIGASFD